MSQPADRGTLDRIEREAPLGAGPVSVVVSFAFVLRGLPLCNSCSHAPQPSSGNSGGG